MSIIRAGDIVTRKSYNRDLFFKVNGFYDKNGIRIFELKGINYRIEADAPEDDLILAEHNELEERFKEEEILFERKLVENRIYEKYRSSIVNMPRNYRGGKRSIKLGRVLHLDGDPEYMKRCVEQYKKLGIEAEGRYVPEKDQVIMVQKLLQEVRPDILVLTGHDGLLKNSNNKDDINNYRNSKYYIEATKAARRIQNDKDSLIIFAGACQSMYQELIKAGANFASSPERVLIHAFDPVLVSQQLAVTSFSKIIDPFDIVTKTITGEKGIGGVQTRGLVREFYPGI